MARAMTRKIGPPCELWAGPGTLEPQKGAFWREIPEDHGFKFTLAPRGDRKRPLKTALQQRTDCPCCTRRALKRQISSTSCRRAAACRNLSRKPAVPEIRLSRSPLQQFSRASEGFGCTQPLTACTGRISASSCDPLAPQPPNAAFRPEMLVPISAAGRESRSWLPSATGTPA